MCTINQPTIVQMHVSLQPPPNNLKLVANGANELGIQFQLANPHQVYKCLAHNPMHPQPS